MNVFTEPAALGVEYIIKKYGKGRAHPPETGEVDNLYCAFRFPLTVLISNICAADTHYSESSLMPMLVNKLLFKIITEKSPFFTVMVNRFNKVSLCSVALEFIRFSGANGCRMKCC